MNVVPEVKEGERLVEGLTRAASRQSCWNDGLGWFFLQRRGE
jgi:hypothetical protein